MTGNLTRTKRLRQMVHKRNLSHLFLIFKIYMEALLKQEPKQVIAGICNIDQEQARPSQTLPLQRCPSKLPPAVQETQKTNLLSSENTVMHFCLIIRWKIMHITTRGSWICKYVQKSTKLNLTFFIFFLINLKSKGKNEQVMAYSITKKSSRKSLLERECTKY